MSMSQIAMDPLSFMYIFFFPLSPTRRLSNLAMRVTRRVSHKKQALLTIREPLSSSLLFGEVCVTHIFSFLFCVFCFVSLRSLSCVQCCQCLGIVHSWLPLRFSLTFIYQKRNCRFILFIDIHMRNSRDKRNPLEI